MWFITALLCFAVAYIFRLRTRIDNLKAGYNTQVEHIDRLVGTIDRLKNDYNELDKGAFELADSYEQDKLTLEDVIKEQAADITELEDLDLKHRKECLPHYGRSDQPILRTALEEDEPIFWEALTKFPLSA